MTKECTSCSRHRPLEAFVYEGKTYKTCAECLTKKAKKRAVKNSMLRDDTQNNVESISLKDLSEYVTESIKNLEPNTGLFLMMQVEITDISIMDDQSFKMLANMIAHNIEEGDGYTWTIKTALRLSTCHENVSTFYFGCSQSYELARDCKESNRQRMNRFDCHGKLIIKIDIPASKVIIKLKHDIIHEMPVNVTTPMEIKQAIMENLNLDPTQLRTYLRDRFDISKITMQQIHYWWSFFTQNFYKSDENHIISTHNFLISSRANGCELCYELINSQIIAIGFTTPLFKNKQLVTEVHCDATYKTAKGRFELYGLSVIMKAQDIH
ncbi:ATP-dependent DNA helicase pif1 [Gigaspora margarita]|uniref:ATP-dependent DNA helicase pif1 n=1 Tax=Gigaspora margarita TaxID=4874 RepID=A0A8H4EPA3_GIGMA|nr:ATP-dependent DNA helicase pif1 [Gigaspora margarita]